MYNIQIELNKERVGLDAKLKLQLTGEIPAISHLC